MIRIKWLYKISLFAIFFLILYVQKAIAQQSSDTAIDIDGNIYSSVIIGKQVWMVENLQVSKFSNGVKIPEVKTAKKWKKAGIKRKPAWCFYENDPNNGKTYGKLFNGFAINDSNGLCPKGWHVPSDEEWQSLVNYLGGFDVAGGKMKAKSKWEGSDEKATTNSSGFTDYLAGNRDCDGTFGRIGENSAFWTSTENDKGNNWVWCLGFNYLGVGRYDYLTKTFGLTVRCLKN